MIYILKWHSGDSSHAYNNIKDVIQKARYHRHRDGTLYMVDTKTLKLKEISLPSTDR